MAAPTGQHTVVWAVDASLSPSSSGASIGIAAGGRPGGPAAVATTARRALEGACDLVLDAVDALLGVEYEEEDLLPCTRDECDDADAPARSSGGSISGLFSAAGRAAFRGLQSLMPKQDECGSFDLLPRTSQQAGWMRRAQSRPAQFVDLGGGFAGYA